MFLFDLPFDNFADNQYISLRSTLYIKKKKKKFAQFKELLRRTGTILIFEATELRGCTFHSQKSLHYTEVIFIFEEYIGRKKYRTDLPYVI